MLRQLLKQSINININSDNSYREMLLTAVDWFIRFVFTIVITITVASRFFDTSATLTLELVSQACYTVITKNIPPNQISLFLLRCSVHVHHTI